MDRPLSQTQARRLQRSLNARIKNLAQSREVSVQHLRFHLIFECFLRRVFAYHQATWVLKGGTALLMRNGSGRFTQDIDLARDTVWESPDDLRHEFAEIAHRQADDPFTFKVTSLRTKSEPPPDGYSAPTVEVRLTAYMGVTPFETIRIDVSPQRHTQNPIVRIPVAPLLDTLIGGESKSFHVLTTAIESHLADKICAMYEPHPSGRSNRFHDLADIIRIIQTQRFSAREVSTTLSHEAARRRIPRPQKLIPPGPHWEKEYEKNAPSYAELPRELHSLTSSLDYAGACLNEVLNQHRTQGVWNPATQQWEGDLE